MRGLRIIETRRARALRAGQTRPEAILWKALRGRALAGFKFVRQEPIGPYFADFACRSIKLVVELDGATHSSVEELARDRRRTDFLRSLGYEVLRFTNEDVYRNLDGALAAILVALAAARGPNPLPGAPAERER